MGISETIVAAIIGALATMITAIFQLVRNRAPEGSKPQKKRMRSLLATIALMVGCVVGGYAWSSLRAVSAKEELQATMKAEFTAQFKALAARQPQLSAAHDPTAGSAVPARHGDTGTAESLAHLSPCRLNPNPDEVGPVICTDRDAQRISLCATVPATAQTTQVRVLARVPGSESPWQERDEAASALGNLHIAEATTGYPVNAEQRSVCLDMSNHSVDETLAVRMVVDYAFGPKLTTGPTTELTAATPAAANF